MSLQSKWICRLFSWPFFVQPPRLSILFSDFPFPQAYNKTMLIKIPLPDNLKEYLAIYTTEYDDSYVLEPIVANDLQEYRDIVKNQQERRIESDFDYDLADPKAGYVLNERMTRIRKLNSKIGENLKLLYGYRCQLCGRMIGEEYGAHIAEAHHIDYYVKSLNNDSNNQMVVCPNHHSIIHEADPKFDRKRMLYLYPNGVEQRVVLNLHLK